MQPGSPKPEDGSRSGSAGRGPEALAAEASGFPSPGRPTPGEAGAPASGLPEASLVREARRPSEGREPSADGDSFEGPRASEGSSPSGAASRSSEESNAPVGWILAAICGSLAAGVLGLGVLLWTSAPPELPDVGEGVHLLPVARDLPEFTLIDQSGALFDRARLEGRWSLLFFGYASCPDVCPTTLQRLAAMEPELRAAEGVRVVFVSVDPDRDGVERLEQYVRFFHESFEGVTGEVEQIDALTGALGVYYAKRAPQDAAGVDSGYLVDHAASLFLIDPQARLQALFDDPSDAESFIARLRRVQSVRRGAVADRPEPS